MDCIEGGTAPFTLDWIGSPDDIAGQIVEYQRKVGGFEIAFLRVNLNAIALERLRK